jgi:uncharacterized protein YndB with AHSA1/START domain
METRSTNHAEKITIETTVNAPVETVWQMFSTPDDIVKWNSASEEWHSPRAENDFREGGKFVFRMEAKDGSVGFDFTGIYDEVKPHETIKYTMEDGRKVHVSFKSSPNGTIVKETFDAENTHPLEMQETGWQAILDKFKAYVEGKQG